MSRPDPTADSTDPDAALVAEQIGQLDQQGRQLSQPDVWDGSLAAQFRGAWPQTSKSLQTVKSELDELRQKIERINGDIMIAGGN